jgi:hypothetical protein
MTRSILALVLASLAGLASLSASAQEVAGRVLLAVGAVTVERGAQRIEARTGTEIRVGDTVQLGAQSNAQLLMTDEAIVALRPDTTFRVKEYTFGNQPPERQRAFFDLVRGGIRTVTGVIGRLNQQNYGVVTPTATVGIRGTHYTLVYCTENCPDAGNAARAEALTFASLEVAQSDAPKPGAGTVSPGVLFGSVTDGQISVTPAATRRETVFGADQYFRLDRADAVPQRLLAPPAILQDRLEGRARAEEKKPAPPGQAPAQQQGGESATAVAQTGAGATTGDSRVSSSITEASLPVALQTNVYQVTTAETATGITNVVTPTSNTGTVFFRLDGGVQLPAIYQDTGQAARSSFVIVDFITLGVNLGLGVARMVVGIRTDDPTNNRVFVATPADIPITVSGGQLTLSGTFLRSSFPQNQLAFRCENCGPNDTVGFVDRISVSGTISGSTATLNLGGEVFNAPPITGGTLDFTATLTQRTPPNNLGAAMIVPRLGGGANTLTTSTFGVLVDGAQAPTQLSSGLLFARRDTATNTIVGSAPDAGNLVWGFWGNSGAFVRDANFQQFTTSGPPSFFDMPWITGQFPNTVPSTLGSSVTYTPVGGVVNGGFGLLNSGSLTANFVNRTLSVNLVASRTSGELNTFTMAGSSSFSPISATFGAGFTSVTCSGPCTSGGNPIGGSFGGFFAGPNAEGAGVAFTAGFAIGNGVSGVAAFKR